MGEVIEFPASESVEKYICADCEGDNFKWYSSCEVEEVYVMECCDCGNPFMIVGQVIDESMLSPLH